MSRPDTFYILGNGPSLTPRIIRALPDGAWLGMNSAFRFWHRIRKYPRYYACLDPVVLRSQFDGIRALLDRPEITDFFLHDCAAELDATLSTHPKVTLLSAFIQRQDHRLPLSRLGYQKQTTGALATRFAIEKGHDDLLLIGIDCKYVEQIDGAAAGQGLELVINKRITSNPNYFFSDYQAAGDRYQVPNPSVHSGNLHLQSFVALRNDLDLQGLPVRIAVGSDRSLLSRYGIFPNRPIWPALGIRRLGAIAVPLTPREWPRLLANLHLWMDPRLRPSLTARTADTCLHLFVSGAPDESLRADIERGLAEVPGLATFFSACRLTFLDIPPEIDHYIRSAEGTDDPATKSGPNVFFLATMAQCKDYEYVLHMETDCLPVRAGWLDAAELEIERAGTQAWVMGPAYFGPSTLDSSYRMHINGNAVYQSGDPDFQAFLQGTFLDILELLLRAGMRTLAYDTALSVARYNFDALPAPLRQALGLALPRFNFSNLIRNVGGGRETRDPSLLSLRALLDESDQTYLLHGRAGFAYLDGDRTFLPEVYRRQDGFPKDTLPFFHVWANDPQWRVDLRGYGRVTLTAAGGAFRDGLLLSFHFYRLRKAFDGRRWSMTVTCPPGMPTFRRASFVLVDDAGGTTPLEAVVQRHEDPSGRLQLTFVSAGNASGRGDVVRVLLHDLSARPDELALLGIEMLEDDAEPQAPRLALEASPRSEACVAMIDRWAALYHALPRGRAGEGAAVLEHWRSAHFALDDFRVEPDRLRMKVTASAGWSPAEGTGPLFFGVLFGQAWHRLSRMRLRLAVVRADEPFQGEVRVRVCRHEQTPWEYIDFPVKVVNGVAESEVLPAPFRHEHRAYRLELLSMPAATGPLSISLDLELRTDEAPVRRPSPATAAPLPATVTPTPAAVAPPSATMVPPSATMVPPPAAVVPPPAAVVPRIVAPSGPRRVPRLLIVDPTIMGTASATGQIKQLFFADWRSADLLQVCDLGREDGALGLARFENGKPSWSPVDAGGLPETCRSFAPEVLYVRPVDNLGFMRVIVPLVEAMARPVALHVMDDWMERARINQPQAFPELMALFMRLVKVATIKLSICAEMSRMLAARYGGSWTPLANGIDPAGHPVMPAPTGAFVVRYMGGLAEDMSLATVTLVARAVEALGSELDVRFEIYTMPWYLETAARVFQGLQRTAVHRFVEAAAYPAMLGGAGALLIAYNFDDASARYTRYSFSNKLPECLASGRPVLLIGPQEHATLRDMRDEPAVSQVTEPELALVVEAIRRLARDPAEAARQGLLGRALAQRRFLAADVKARAAGLMAGMLGLDQAPLLEPIVDKLSFRDCNHLARQGQWMPALAGYARLMADRPLRVYEDNGRRCVRELGLDDGTWEQAVEAAVTHVRRS